MNTYAFVTAKQDVFLEKVRTPKSSITVINFVHVFYYISFVHSIFAIKFSILFIKQRKHKLMELKVHK
jgi:hypothetical protein